MTILLTGVPRNFGRGRYNVKITGSTGTAIIQYEVANEGMADVPDAAGLVAGDSISIDFPSCDVQSVITGDLVVNMNPVS